MQKDNSGEGAAPEISGSGGHQMRKTPNINKYEILARSNDLDCRADGDGISVQLLHNDFWYARDTLYFVGWQTNHDTGRTT